MAHPCFSCGSECYCHGDIDDVIVCKTPRGCDGCGCEDNESDDYDYDYGNDEDDFYECSKCDGHDACRDFGCAIANGLGRLVNTDPNG